jgi:DNA-binding response OmpR family regulator
MNKILYLEDDINLSNTLTDFLEENGFKVVCVYNSQSVLDILEDEQFDLLILDVNVPPFNGFELLNIIRTMNINTPAIFTTSLNDIDDIEDGYNSGCNDYVKKPFIFKELLFRINTLLNQQINTKLIHIEPNITFDTKTNELTKNKELIYLKNKEVKLLKLFLKFPNKIVSFEDIYNYVWDFNEDVSDGSLRNYIRSLRKIFGNDKIISIKKQGYKFVK